ncbi:DHH family phosphoesterase, partial [Escherichia coli]|nr:DHH family phosphoesterase [Escherichia coli]
FETSDPLYYRAEPVGCTTTILLKMFRENEVEVSKTVAGLMLSAIISDTLLFQSPTCTQEDKVAAQKLAQIADVDIQSYGME